MGQARGWLRALLLVGGWVASGRAAADAVVSTHEAAQAGQARAALTITSNTDCPSGPAVLAALAVMAPPSEWPHGSVRIHATTDLLLVDLTFEESTRREVQVTDDCQARAATVALVIATWAGQLASDAAAMPVLPTRVATAAPPAKAATPTAPAASAGTEREVGAGLLLAVSGGVAPGIAVHVVQSSAPRGLGWQLAFTLPARRERSAAGGTTGWTRAAASIALDGRLPVGRFAASADAGLAGAYTMTSGDGYRIDQGTQALTGGLAAGVRLAMPWRRLHLWTDLRVYRWMFPQKVAITTTEGTPIATTALPSSDFQWAVGIAYVFR